MTIEEIKKLKFVTKADIKFLEDFIIEQGDTKSFKNPITEEIVLATGYLAGLIKFIYDVETCKEEELLKYYNEKLTLRNLSSKINRAKNLIMKIDSNVYYLLID